MNADQLIHALENEIDRQNAIAQDIERRTDQAPFHATVRALQAVVRAVKTLPDEQENSGDSATE